MLNYELYRSLYNIHTTFVYNYLNTLEEKTYWQKKMYVAQSSELESNAMILLDKDSKKT